MDSDYAKRAGLGYYLAWVPLTGIVIVLLAASDGMAWDRASLTAAPLCAIYAIVCRSSRYLCRAFPLQRASLPRVLTAHGAGAAAASGLWIGLAGLLGLQAQLPLLFGVGVLLYLLSVAYHYLAAALESSRQAERSRMQAQVLAREAQLEALKARLNPHFLFNSLHSISALTAADPARAREMCILLAEFLRASLGAGEHGSIPLREELALARKYLAIEKVRFGERMTVSEEIEEAAEACLVPPLLLQPLVENAVKHGIAMMTASGTVHLAAAIGNQRLRVAVENSFDPEARGRSATGLGLEIVRRRLKARYGEEAKLVTRTPDSRFLSELFLPVEQADRRVDWKEPDAGINR
jgi:two-component system, LytTR family, sensor histidine kinase AlgZ